MTSTVSVTAGLALQGLSHLAITVIDVPAAVRFWTEVMGFELTSDSPHLAMFIHRAGRIAVVVADQDGAAGGHFDHRRPGLDHVAFAVTDDHTMRAWAGHLSAAGVTHSGVTESDAGLHLNLRAPDDIPIELFVLSAEAAAAFGLTDPGEGFAHGHTAG